MSIENPANDREQQIKDLYINLLGRDPDPGGWQTYVFDSNEPVDIIRRHIEGSDEYYKRNNPALFGVGKGRDAGKSQQGQYFDPADYIEALKLGGSNNLVNTRFEVLDWLRDPASGQRWLRTQDRPGVQNTAMPDGINLFDRIEGAGTPNRDINPSWGDYATNPESGQWFGHADLMATRAIRFKEHQIKSVLDQNLHWLRDDNLPASMGGKSTGVYESLNLTLDHQPEHDTTRPESPKVTRTPSEYDVNITRETISQPARDSLKMTPGQAFVGKTARGVNKAKRTRRRVRQTTDLQRSLNIS